MIGTAVIVIIILFMIIWITLFGMLCKVSKRLESIEVYLIIDVTYKQEVMEMKIDYISSLLEEIEETLTNENKEKEKR